MGIGPVGDAVTGAVDATLYGKNNKARARFNPVSRLPQGATATHQDHLA